MVLGLLTASLVSIVCFIITVFMGFMMVGRTGLGQHFLFGFFTTFLVTLAQSMTMFYFIGTGKQVKDLVANHPRRKHDNSRDDEDAQPDQRTAPLHHRPTSQKHGDLHDDPSHRKPDQRA